MSTYVLNDTHGRHRPRSWHIVRNPLAHARTFAAFCGRTIVGDTIEDTPMAATCETCYRYSEKARERLPEDDGSTALVDAPDVP